MKNGLLEELIKNKVDFCVEVNNDAERDELLSLYDNYSDIRWVDDNSKPTNYKPTTTKYPLYIYLDCGDELSYDYTYSSYERVKKYVFKNLTPPKQEIHITCKGRETHAILKEDGKVVKHTIAKCHPKDEFDFEMGSKIAYDRLFGMDIMKNPFCLEHLDISNTETIRCELGDKSRYNFKVGDKVKIRQWNNMVEEFGLDAYGNIKTRGHTFSKGMKYLCGKIATIKDFDKGCGGHLVLEFSDKIEDNCWDYALWHYTTDMLEPYTPRLAKVGEYVRVIDNTLGHGFSINQIVKCVYADNYYTNKFVDSTGGLWYMGLQDYEILDDYVPSFNCKFVVTKDIVGLTKGVVYEVKDGSFKDDDNIILPIGDKDKLINLEDLEFYINKKGAECIVIKE
nr:MAG TPA: ubiquitin ligase [Caudoviricetes sp.]